ncbi:hypothetical protein BGY98DRAFT_336965 [Russula aff. rugulosa BPL654]|nr:hypothetical protein BGY98DRAFT_336965 [Russula aff. rugulosa BPL654]
MQLPKDFESITLPDGTTQTLGPTRVTRLLFSRTSLCWVTESVRNSYNLSTPPDVAIKLIESVLMNNYQLFRKYFELILLLQHRLSPMLLKTLSERSASLLALRDTRVFSLQFSPKLETEDTLGLLIKLVGGETDASEPRLA